MRSTETRARVRALAERERARQAPRFGPRARAFLDQKVEGVLEAPVGVCVCCVPPPAGTEVLGRATIPATDIYSTACAIQNLWLTARAEGLGVGWVSFYRPDELRAVLGIPAAVEPVAWLCVGWPDERPVRPGLERAGWARRRPLADVVHRERWAAGEAQPASSPMPDAAARIAARDRADLLVKPAGSLGALEDVVERWSAATGAPPPAPLRAAHLVCAADHGHAARGTSLFDGAVSGQVAAAAARGDTAIGVLARAREETLVVADVGLRGPTPPGCLARRCADGTADFVAGPAMGADQRDAALAAGGELARALLAQSGADCLVLGEIGIGNTATAAALLCALTGAQPAMRWSAAARASTPRAWSARRARSPRRSRRAGDAPWRWPRRCASSAAWSSPRSPARSTPPTTRARRWSSTASPSASPRSSPCGCARPAASGSSPGTARPSPPMRSCSPSSGSSRCSTCACGSARPAAPRSRCR